MLSLSQTSCCAVEVLACLNGPEEDFQRVEEIIRHKNNFQTCLSKFIRLLTEKSLVKLKEGFLLYWPPEEGNLYDTADTLEWSHILDEFLLSVGCCVELCPTCLFGVNEKKGIVGKFESRNLAEVSEIRRCGTTSTT